MANPINRRRFLKVSATTGGSLVIGFSLFGCKSTSEENKANQPKAKKPEDKPTERDPRAAGEPGELNAWIRIDGDDTVTLTISEAEMGQGVLTALAMILAEELDADWAKVRSQHAMANEKAYGRQGTGGSSSVRKGYDPLRKVGAQARAMLIAAAAKRWGVDASECRTEPSVVIHDKTSKRARFGELASDAAGSEVPASPKLKDKKDFRLIGKSIKRLDTPDKVKGAAEFGIDVKRPGMVVAQVVHCPIFGGKLKSFDGASAQAVAGVQQIVDIPTGVAIVADHYWAAKKGRDALKIEWDPGTSGDLSTASARDKMKSVVGKGVPVPENRGDAENRVASAKRKVEAVYEVPYLAHSPMEPLNCTAEVRKDDCEIWVSTQSPSNVVKVAAEITGFDKEKITVHTAMLGGGFGRRSQSDFVADAVHLSKAIGKPVQVVWSREDEIRGGFYRPAAYNEFVGSVDKDGWPEAWVHRIASPAILTAFGPLKNGIDGTSVEGAANLPYDIPHFHVTYADPELPVSTWFWRSVGSSQNAYVTECFLDELAALGKKDPVEVRRRLLKGKPRHLRVLDTVVDKAGWNKDLPKGHAHGVAVHESFGSFVAQVAEVSIDKGKVRVHRVVCAIDCGDVVNPSIVEAQIESGIVYGLTAALHGKIDLKGGAAVQSNFHDYPALRIDEMPKIETHIIAKGDPLGGLGEPGTPPIAPAVCNAIFALTGKPARTLPLGKLA